MEWIDWDMWIYYNGVTDTWRTITSDRVVSAPPKEDIALLDVVADPSTTGITVVPGIGYVTHDSESYPLPHRRWYWLSSDAHHHDIP